MGAGWVSWYLIHRPCLSLGVSSGRIVSSGKVNVIVVSSVVRYTGIVVFPVNVRVYVAVIGFLVYSVSSTCVTGSSVPVTMPHTRSSECLRMYSGVNVPVMEY